MTVALDREKLLKLLALLASDQDGEALAAARRIVAMLRQAGLDWDGLIAHPGSRSWSQAFAFSALYLAERKRRTAAERNAESWQSIARAREAELGRLRAATPEPEARPRPAPDPETPRPAARRRAAARVTGHELIDRLLAMPELAAAQRARVEAIATWFRKTRSLTRAEETDLETLLRQVETAGGAD